MICTLLCWSKGGSKTGVFLYWEGPNPLLYYSAALALLLWPVILTLFFDLLWQVRILLEVFLTHLKLDFEANLGNKRDHTTDNNKLFGLDVG